MEKPAAASSSLWQQQHLLLLYRENMLIKHLSISQYNTFMCNEVMVFAQSNVISLMNEQYLLFISENTPSEIGSTSHKNT